jgi:hypothetical protein
VIRKLVGVVVLLAVGGALGYYALAHHIVRSDEGLVTVPKRQVAIADTYADIRAWKLADFRAHPDLVKALVDAGHADLIPGQIAGDLANVIRGAVEGIFKRDDRK